MTRGHACCAVLCCCLSVCWPGGRRPLLGRASPTELSTPHISRATASSSATAPTALYPIATALIDAKRCHAGESLLSLCCSALGAGLAGVAGPEGLHIAHAWLAEMIVHLSRQIEASRSARKGAAPQVRAALLLLRACGQRYAARYAACLHVWKMGRYHVYGANAALAWAGFTGQSIVHGMLHCGWHRG